MIFITLLGFVGSFAQAASASPKLAPPGKTFWLRRDGREIYGRIDGSMKARQTLLLLNGLDRGLESWEPFIEPLLPHFRIIRLDMWGQGQTLNRNGLRDSFAVSETVQDIEAVVRGAGTVGPLSVVGHSFGGGVAIALLGENRLKIQQVFLLAPFVPRLEEEQPFIGDTMRAGRGTAETTMPRDFYDFSFDLWTRSFMYFTHNFSPGGLRTPWQTEAAVRLTSAIRDVPVNTILNNPKARVHMVVAGGDYMIPRAAHERMWARIPRENRGFYVSLFAGSHYINERSAEALPAAHLVGLALKGDRRLQREVKGVAYLREKFVDFGDFRIPFGTPSTSALISREKPPTSTTGP